MMDGWPHKKQITKEIRPFYIRKNELSIDRECLFWGFRIIVPVSCKDQILSEIHKSHFGIVRMKEIARSYFWWPKLDRDIELVTQTCMICLQNSKTPPKTQKPWPIPPGPWHRLHADFLGPFYNKMYLVVVDSFSKWPEVFEMSNITSNKTIEAFKNIFSRFGLPNHLVTDNGRSFTSSEFRDFCKCNQIKHTFSAPYHPATNGAAERFVGTFKTAVTKIKENGHTLSTAINIFLNDYRSTPQKSTGVAPSKLMLGREIRNRFSLLRPPPIEENMKNVVSKRKIGNRKTNLVVGEKVMVRDYRKEAKPWVQGVVLAESVPGLTYMIDVEGQTWKRHVDQIVSCSQCDD